VRERQCSIEQTPQVFVRNNCSSEQCDHPVAHASAASNQFVHLVAAMLPAYAPLAEVFAVIRQQVITIFAQALAGAFHDLVRIKPSRLRGAYPNRASLGKLRQRHFFYRTPTQSAHKATVLHDAAVAYVDPMMRVSPAWGQHVRADRRLSLRTQGLIAEPQPPASAGGKAKVIRVHDRGRRSEMLDRRHSIGESLGRFLR